MAQFKFDVPVEARFAIQQTTIEIVGKQAVKDLPPYEEFVWKLEKSMANVAEELHHGTTGISGEAGELLDISKKLWIYNKPIDIAHLIEELGDLRFYYQAVLNMLGITDQDVRAQNMKKLMVRYSEGVYSDKQAQERADKQAAQPQMPPGRRFFAGEGQHGSHVCKFPGCTAIIGSKVDYCSDHPNGTLAQAAPIQAPLGGKTATQIDEEAARMDKPISDNEIEARRRRALQDDPDTVGDQMLDSPGETGFMDGR